MKKKISFCIVLLATMLTADAQTAGNLKVIDSTTSFDRITETITRGAVIKTSTLHFYEINDKISQKLFIAQPQVVVYQDGKKYRIKIEGIDKLLTCNKIQEVIESNIDGYFKGWDGNTTFTLINQQEWIQDNPTRTIFANLYRPAVLIYLTAEGYKMKIAGVEEDPILVKKLR